MGGDCLVQVLEDGRVHGGEGHVARVLLFLVLRWMGGRCDRVDGSRMDQSRVECGLLHDRVNDLEVGIGDTGRDAVNCYPGIAASDKQYEYCSGLQ